MNTELDVWTWRIWKVLVGVQRTACDGFPAEDVDEAEEDRFL